MAGELQETTRVYARNVARIEPDWIEQAAAHLVERDLRRAPLGQGARRGRRLRERDAARPGARGAAQGELRPDRPGARARDLHRGRARRRASSSRRIPSGPHNRKLIHEIEELEHRARRPDVLVDDRALYAYYDARVPQDVRDARSFDTWYREAARGTPKLLFLAREDLMRHGAESVTEELFPRELRDGRGRLPARLPLRARARRWTASR